MNSLSGIALGQKIVIKFDKALVGDVTGNAGAFTVTALQRNPLGTGDLAPKTYAVASVQRYVLDGIEQPDTILLNFDSLNQFNNAEGFITVSYNQNLGTLAGNRPVESFAANFLPIGLIGTPTNPHSIQVGITDLLVAFKKIQYINAYTQHNISTGITDLVVNFIHIDDINP